jgi:dienelactone hydrolase
MKPIVLVLLSTLLPALVASSEEKLPARDERAGPPRTLNTLRDFPEVDSRAAWETRREDIRRRVLVSCGLWPMPARPAVEARVFDRVERDGYTVEKVWLQTWPGFYLAGNLFRPLGQGTGPFPAVLNPHGHWKNGRLADEPAGSIAARCINFARRGMIAFSYDMAGYNDTAQVDHKFAADPTNQLWSVSLMGLQLWNTLRALDWLAALPDADPARLACTGESGGGTQTFLLGAVDDRPAVLAPIVMVSHSMQGGCLCENAPGLRVEFSNMELSAAAGPRPQILVAASGDWTKKTMEVEGPAIEKVYRLLGAKDHLRYVLFQADHNYNQTSREAVYEFFGRWLLRHPEPATLKELPYTKEPDEKLRVFPDKQFPEGALDAQGLIASFIQSARAQWAAHAPGRTSLEKFKATWLPAWRATLHIDESRESRVLAETFDVRRAGGRTFTRLALGRPDRGDRLPAVMITPTRDTLRQLVVLAHPDGKGAFLDASGAPTGLAKALLDRNQSVLLLDTFLTGELADPAAAAKRKPFENYFTTYNRTDAQERVRDLVTACQFAHGHSKGRKVVLAGAGRAGLWALLAAPAADAVVADAQALDLTTDREWMQPDLFVPGLRRLGGFSGAAALAAPNALLIHHAGDALDTAVLRDAYAGQPGSFREEKAALNDDAVADWITSLNRRRAEAR